MSIIIKSGSSTDTALVTPQNAVKVDASASIQPVTASSLPLPTGAATSVKQPAIGTSGTASVDVITVQGIAGATPIPVTGTVTETSPANGANGSPVPAQATQVGGSDGTNLRAVKVSSTGVVSVDGSAFIQPVSGTVTANAGTGTMLVDGSAHTQPVSGSITANIGTTNGVALDATVSGLQVAQGSNTSGENGSLIQGAVTTSAPSYTTAKTNPLSLNTAGGLRVDGSGTTQPVSAISLPLPSGASTSAKQPALGTAGTASADVISIQGIASMIPIKVDGSAVTQPVSGTVTSNVGTTNGLALDSSINSLLKPASTLSAITTLGSITSALPAGANTLGKVDQGVTGSSPWITNVSQIGGNNISTGTGTGGSGIPRVTVSNDSNILSTQSGTWTNRIQDSAGGSLNSTSGSLNSFLPDKTSLSNSVTASGQTVPINTVGTSSLIMTATGTFVATLTFEATLDGTSWFTWFGVSNTSLNNMGSITVPDQVFFNVSAIQQFRVRCSAFTSGTVVVSLATSQGFSGIVSSQAMTNGSMDVMINGTPNTNAAQGAPNTLGNSWPIYISDSVNGAVAVKPINTAAVGTDKSLVVALSPNSPIPSGTNVIGHVINDASTAVIGHVIVDSGTITSNIGTTNGLALDTSVNGILLSQGSTTSGQKGSLNQGAVTTNAPSYTNAQTSPVSLDTSGLLRVSIKDTPQNTNAFKVDGSATTQPISAASLPLPAGAATSALQTTGNTSLAAIAASSVAQGSTTSGQTGELQLGAVTTASPAYTTGQTSPVSLTTLGALRTDSSGTTQPISAASLPLPALASTSTIQTNGTQKSQIVDGSGNVMPAGNINANGAFVRPGDGTNTQGYTASNEAKVLVTPLTNTSIVKAQLQDNSGTSINASSYGRLRVNKDPTDVFSDKFDGALDTTNRWTNVNVGTGTVSSATSSATFTVGSTANNAATLFSQATFAHRAAVPLVFNSVLTLETTTIVTGNHRFFGLGSAGTNTTANPLTDAAGFEIDTTGTLNAVVYASGTKISSIALTIPVDGKRHLYIMEYRSDKAVFYIDNISVATTTIVGSSPDNETLPVRYHSINGATPSGTPTLAVAFAAIGDAGANNIAISDGTFGWRRATVSAAGRLAVDAFAADSAKATYSATTIGLAPAAAATDILTINGSATKTIKITKIEVSATQTTAGIINIVVLKRSTANTGTSTALTLVPHDSNDAAATATVVTYTANPTTGTLVGNLKSQKIFLSTASATADPTQQVWTWGDDGKEPTLRGVAQSLSVNLQAQTVVGGSINISIEFTEE